MTNRLGSQQVSALFALMSAGGELSNTELDDIAGFRIKKDVRERLNREGLVTSRTERVPHVHTLTDKGWAWCGQVRATDRPAGAGSLGGALYAILDRLFQKRKLRPADLFGPADEVTALEGTTDKVVPDNLESVIRAAYQALAVKRRDWVRLVDLRARLNGATKAEVDRVLIEMSAARQAHLAPDSNRKALTDADHAAAVRIGDEDKHLLAIEES